MHDVSDWKPNFVHGIQYNIRSMKAYHDQVIMYNNIKRHRIGVTFLQETRAKRGGIFCPHGLIRIVSPADEAGSYGCEIIVNPMVAFMSNSSTGKHIRIAKADISIIASMPRLLVARVSTKGVADFFLISGHAPYKSCKQSYAKYWEVFRSTIHKTCVPTSCARLCGIDANCQMYASELWRPLCDIGVRTDKAPPNFVCFQCAMEDVSMNPANCCSAKLSNGVAGTFIPSKGSKQIILDYVCHSNDIVIKDASVLQRPECGIHNAPSDHIPLGFTFLIPARANCEFEKRRRLQYDPEAIVNHISKPEFLENLVNAPVVMYDMCNTAHCHFTDEHIRTCLETHFPVTRVSKPKLPYISHVTF